MQRFPRRSRNPSPCRRRWFVRPSGPVSHAMPQPNDYAVIVGVQTYPGLDDPTSDSFRPLLGPVNDASAFTTGSRPPAAGTSPRRTPTSSPGSRPLAADDRRRPADREPGLQGDEEALRPGEAGGQHAGRRLYIYMAGHGIEVSSKEPALLMADAAPASSTTTSSPVRTPTGSSRPASSTRSSCSWTAAAITSR